MLRLKKEFHFFQQLLLRIGLILILFSVIRLIFYVVYQDQMSVASWSSLVYIFVHAFRFDLAALTYINSFLIISYLLPIPIRFNKIYRRFQAFIFILFNLFALAIEIADIQYFEFASRRSIISDFSLLFNAIQYNPNFIRDSWPLLFIFFPAAFLLYYLYKKTTLVLPTPPLRIGYQIPIFLGGLILFVIAARGGTQLRPIMNTTAIHYVDDLKQAPLMTNTSLSMIFSAQQRSLKIPAYFTKEELAKRLPFYTQNQSDSIFVQKNVVLIVLESFGKEYIGHFNNQVGYTPFLDSLISKSIYAEHSFANGLRSTQGIAAITAGLPALMEDPFMFSAYNTTQLNGIAHLLKKKSYTSAFFHGANNGSMDFERFSKSAGFDHYIDREDYGLEKDYDGSWGIWDDPFFQFSLNKINTFQQPFFGQLFSLTSHHPFEVEAWFAKKHPDMDEEYRAVRYTDFALQHFFEVAAEQAWFENTLFIITADHVPRASKNTAYHDKVSRYKVPIIFYDPLGTFPKIEKPVMQHIDILPTLMDYLNYDLPYTTFGESALNPASGNFCYIYDGIYYIFDQKYVLMYDGNEGKRLFDYKADPRTKNEVLNPEINKQFSERLQAIIQKHHEGMIGNSLVD